MKHLTVILLIASLGLTSCGRVEIQVEPTPTIVVSPMSPSSATSTPRTGPTASTATPSPLPTLSPTALVTPPSSLIAFVTGFEQSLSDIAVIRSDGTGYLQLTSYGYNFDPVLSPDRRFIAYRSVPASITSLPDPGPRLYEGSYNIWAIAVDGAQAWKLTDSEALRSIPAWSADSAKVLFSEGEAGTIVEVDLATQTQHAWLAQDGFAPSYKPDGNGIGYLNAEGDLIWLEADATSHLVVDANATSPHMRVNDFSWMPDSARVVYALADDSERIGGSTLGITYTLWLLPLGDSAIFLADDAHNVQPSPDGKTLALQIGSGYGDACFVDLQQGFLDLTHTPYTPIRVDDFVGRPAGDSFYPTSPVTWLSESFATASFGVTCAPSGVTSGPYWIDVSGQQLQQITPQTTP